MAKIPSADTSKLTLAIETSCDETAVAITKGTQVIANSIYSQIDLHKQYGGVVPGIAKLAHQQKFGDVLNDALATANMSLSDIEQIAVTKGPGLAIALEVGIAKAKELAVKLNLPLIAVNHMAGHLYSPLTAQTVSPDSFRGPQEPRDAGSSPARQVNFPVLALLVSGKHTEFVLLKDLYTPEVLGATLDDGCGEAFDKFAMMLGLEYPGGPIISKLANEYRDKLEVKLERVQRTLFVVAYDVEELGHGSWDVGESTNSEPTTRDSQPISQNLAPITHNPQPKYRLPIPMAYSGDLNVSYSGLKTAIKQLINHLSGSSERLNIKQTGAAGNLSAAQIGELCVVFESAAIHILILKLEQAIKEFSPKELWIGGGVAANGNLQTLVRELGEKHNLTVRIPQSRGFLTDNAAMIGVAAAIQLESGRAGEQESKTVQIYLPSELDKLDRDPSWEL